MTLIEHAEKYLTHPTMVTRQSLSDLESYRDQIKLIAMSGFRDLTLRERVVVMAINARIEMLEQHGIKRKDKNHD